MPMIDTEHLKPELQRVAHAEATLHEAMQALKAANAETRRAALDQVDQAREAFQAQCQQFYGYIQQAVARAEANG